MEVFVLSKEGGRGKRWQKTKERVKDLVPAACEEATLGTYARQAGGSAAMAARGSRAFGCFCA